MVYMVKYVILLYKMKEYISYILIFIDFNLVQSSQVFKVNFIKMRI